MFLKIALATFCVSLFNDVPMEISKETTYITRPLTQDGRVDYFRALELKFYPKNMKTDENGYRILVRKLGPFVDNDTEYAEILAKQVYEKLGLDPATKPTMTYEEPYKFLHRYVKSRHKGEKKEEDKKEEKDKKEWWEADEATIKEIDAIDSKTGHPWTLKTLPMMAEWLDKNGPALDLLAEAVHKPSFRRPLTRLNDEANLLSIMLPDIQHIRSFARGLAARVNYYIGTGQIDKAIDDIITLEKLGRRTGCQGVLVDALVGISVEGIGNAVNLAGSLEHPPTEAQLKRLVKELGNLPPRTTFQETLLSERYIMLDMIQSWAHKKATMNELFGNTKASKSSSLKITQLLGFDWNTVACRMNWYYDNIGHMDIEAAAGSLKTKPMMMKLKLLSSTNFRSEIVADYLAQLVLPATNAVQEAFRRTECSGRIQRITLAMLLYEKEHGRLPAAYTVDKDGKPLQSWRVLLLPYLGEKAKKLYDQIKLDEPWDSPHNKRFHAAAVEFYQCPSAKLEPGKTTYSVVVGEKAAFQAGEGKTFKQLGPNSGTMILVIENHTPCNWMDPTADLTETNVKEVLEKGTVHSGIIMVGLRGGGVSIISESIERKKFQQGIKGADRKWLDYE